MGVRSNRGRQSQANLAWDTLIDLTGTGPLHERLAAAFRAVIRAGTVPAGSALPPSRALAETLGCSRWAVTEAYAQLGAEGYVEARAGSATRVRAPATESTPAPVSAAPTATPRLNLAPGLPDLRSFPRSRWLDAVRSVINTASYADFDYPPTEGHPRLREVLAEYLTRVRGARAQADSVLVTAGVSAGVARVCLALRSAGVRTVAVEDPGWPRLWSAVRAAGLEAVGVPVDADGLRVDLLPAKARAVVVAPAHQFPSGSVLAPDRRTALLAWAREVDGLVLEDDYDAEFRYDRKPVGTLQGMDPGRVALFGSVNKTLLPALSLGWCVAPGRWVDRIRSADELTLSPPVVDQLALARFVTSGAFDRHMRASRQRYRVRRNALLEALHDELPTASVSGVAAGLHLLLHLTPGIDAAAIVDAARQSGVRVANLDSYRMTPDPAHPALVLGYGALADSGVREAVSRLAATLRSPRAGSRAR